MVAASGEIELFCFIIGDEPNNIFPIQIERDRTVGNMKAKIKDENKHALQGIDAKSLVLWMVDEPLDSTNEESLKCLVPQDDCAEFQKLVSWKPISGYWPSQPSRGRLHVVVQLPSKVAKKTNKLMKILRSSAFRGTVLGFIPWIAALYFVIKTLQASAAQAYTSLLADNVPEYIVGFVTNMSTSHNLQSYGDMINFGAAGFMPVFTAVVLGLLIFFLALFSWISVDDNDLEITT